MPRLGEQLTSAGVVSADKVAEALRAQVVWGGRLGTNLIELGCIDLDELSRALGQQHGVAAALGRHFDKADPALQAQLPAGLARQFSVVPLVRLSPERIAIVALDPLSDTARAALGAIYGVDPDDGIVMSVAAEMRVLYHLERAYKIMRPTRYLRTKGPSVTTFPQFDLSFELDVEVEPEIVDELAPIELEVDAPSARSERRTSGSMAAISVDDIAAMMDHAIQTAPEHAQDGPAGRDRRTYLRTLADDVAPPAPTKPPVIQIPPRPTTAKVQFIAIPPLVPPPVAAPPTAPPPPPVAQSIDPPTFQAHGFDAPTVSSPSATAEALRASLAAEPAVARTDTGPITGALGRIAIRRVAVSTAPEDEKLVTPTNFVDSTRAIKRGSNRDRVAELVIETLERYVPSCAAALLLVIRGDVAIGWKHFSRADDGTSEVAVPLDQDGIVPTAIGRKVATRCLAEDLGAIDMLLLRAVGNGDDNELVVVPIAIGDQVMCVLAAAAPPDAEVVALETVASAAGAAFARLIRDASR